MSSELIVSVSGIRGIVGEGLTAEATTRFAAAYGAFVKGGRADALPVAVVARVP